MKVQIGIISHKPGRMFQRCMESLVKINAGIDYDLLLQLTPGTNAENWNRLVERATADYLCILEDDTAALKPLWLASLVETMDNLPDAGIIMPIETKDGSMPDPGFLPWLDKTVEVPTVYGFCNLIRIGIGLRADEKLTYFVDVDLGYQAIRKGYKCYCNGHVWMLHGDTEGRMSTRPDIEELQAKDRAYLEKKWTAI